MGEDKMITDWSVIEGGYLRDIMEQPQALAQTLETLGTSKTLDYLAALLTQAGHEFSVSCKTYVTALMALKWLGDVLCKRDPRRIHQQLSGAAPVVADYLSAWREHVDYLAKELSGIRHLFLVGRGISL